MLAIAGLVCGFVFGWGLMVSGMMQPAKVLAFLDIFGISNGVWDPSLAVVMAAALAVSWLGYAFARQRERPLFAAQSLWPTRIDIDTPLIAGSALFGIGWGLVGLCPGPALENLATLSPQVIVFVAAMAIGMVAHDQWQQRRVAPADDPLPAAADG
jgi:uncharacterized membrane protein YedE/YeeE